MARERLCMRADCNRPVKCQNRCGAHYQRYLRRDFSRRPVRQWTRRTNKPTEPKATTT